ncbi:unnamed protein product [Prorocentrum cordatum]|uniref:Uncharacterized protein n=1 Tax=Prorocentrum cordatum TaxID=2364126 RepID=A0ABN9UNY1_9DINO|nr:unnamed protein product [Polarella glacialis]
MIAMFIKMMMEEVAHKSRQHLEAHCAVTGLGDTSGKQANNHGSNKQILWNPTPPHFKKSRCFKLWEEERKREREREEREMEREERGSEHDPRARARQPVTPTTPNETVKPAMPSGSRPAPQSKW